MFKKNIFRGDDLQIHNFAQCQIFTMERFLKIYAQKVPS